VHPSLPEITQIDEGPQLLADHEGQRKLRSEAELPVFANRQIEPKFGWQALEVYRAQVVIAQFPLRVAGERSRGEVPQAGLEPARPRDTAF
jgi:hypothetical protein